MAILNKKIARAEKVKKKRKKNTLFDIINLIINLKISINNYN